MSCYICDGMVTNKSSRDPGGYMDPKQVGVLPVVLEDLLVSFSGSCSKFGLDILALAS